jgi:hypothetical protein
MIEFEDRLADTFNPDKLHRNLDTLVKTGYCFCLEVSSNHFFLPTFRLGLTLLLLASRSALILSSSTDADSSFGS